MKILWKKAGKSVAMKVKQNAIFFLKRKEYEKKRKFAI